MVSLAMERRLFPLITWYICQFTGVEAFPPHAPRESSLYEDDYCDVTTKQSVRIAFARHVMKAVQRMGSEQQCKSVADIVGDDERLS